MRPDYRAKALTLSEIETHVAEVKADIAQKAGANCSSSSTAGAPAANALSRSLVVDVEEDDTPANRVRSRSGKGRGGRGRTLRQAAAPTLRRASPTLRSAERAEALREFKEDIGGARKSDASGLVLNYDTALKKNKGDLCVESIAWGCPQGAALQGVCILTWQFMLPLGSQSASSGNPFSRSDPAIHVVA